MIAAVPFLLPPPFELGRMGALEALHACLTHSVAFEPKTVHDIDAYLGIEQDICTLARTCKTFYLTHATPWIRKGEKFMHSIAKEIYVAPRYLWPSLRHDMLQLECVNRFVLTNEQRSHLFGWEVCVTTFALHVFMDSIIRDYSVSRGLACARAFMNKMREQTRELKLIEESSPKGILDSALREALPRGVELKDLQFRPGSFTGIMDDLSRELQRILRSHTLMIPERLLGCQLFRQLNAPDDATTTLVYTFETVEAAAASMTQAEMAALNRILQGQGVDP